MSNALGIVIGLAGIAIGILQTRAARRVSAANAAYAHTVLEWLEQFGEWQAEFLRPASPQDRLRHPGGRERPPMPAPPDYIPPQDGWTSAAKWIRKQFHKKKTS